MWQGGQGPRLSMAIHSPWCCIPLLPQSPLSHPAVLLPGFQGVTGCSRKDPLPQSTASCPTVSEQVRVWGEGRQPAWCDHPGQWLCRPPGALQSCTSCSWTWPRNVLGAPEILCPEGNTCVSSLPVPWSPQFTVSHPHHGEPQPQVYTWVAVHGPALHSPFCLICSSAHC